MNPSEDNPSSVSAAQGGDAFPPTAWSMICQIQGDDQHESGRGWERLAKGYWQPLYAFLRRRGAEHHAACDDVQGFFAHILSKPFLRQIEPGNRLFRAFLLAALQNWRVDQHRAAVALKRGGGQPTIPLNELNLAEAPSTEGTPEEAFDRQWARSVYDNALAELRERQKSRGRAPQYERLCGLLTGQAVAKYQEIATALGMSEGAVKQAAADLRKEFGAVLRGEIRRTVADESQVEGELRYLLGILKRSS